jgi:hypothetical protein
MQIVAQASNFAQIKELASSLCPKVTLVDVHTDGMHYVTLAQLASRLMDPWLLAMSIWTKH